MYPSTVQSTLGGSSSPVVRPVPDDRARAQPRGFVESVDVVYGTDDAEAYHLEATTPSRWCTPMGGRHHRLGHGTARNHCGTGNACASFTERHDAFTTAQVLSKWNRCRGSLSADGPLMAAALPDDPAIVRAGPVFMASSTPVASSRSPTSSPRQVVGWKRSATDRAIDQDVPPCRYNHPRGGYKGITPASTFIWNAWVTLVESSTKCRRCTTAVWCTWKPGTGRCSGWPTASSSPQRVMDGVPALTELGIAVHSPHQWYVDLDADRVKALAAQTDRKDC